MVLTHFRRIYRKIRNYLMFSFGLTRRERIGLLVIYPLAALGMFISTRVDSGELTQDEAAALEFAFMRLESWQEPQAAPLIPFRADTISEDQLRSFGIPKRLASNWVNYREKAGGFRDADQLRRLYGMNDSVFNVLEPWLKWENSRNDSDKPKPGQHQALDMNLADTLLWQSLRGIGPVFARRIVAYRELLGGYVSAGQLREVYGLDTALCDRLIPNLYVAEGFEPRPLNLNQASYADLRAHPYLSARQASAIVMYRSQHGPLISRESLNQIILLDSATLERLGPYLPDFSTPHQHQDQAGR